MIENVRLRTRVLFDERRVARQTYRLLKWLIMRPIGESRCEEIVLQASTLTLSFGHERERRAA